jgi:phosphinothricin acetyltransferase
VIDVAPMAAGHVDAVLAIYQAGIDTGDATFETSVPSWSAWDATHLAAHRFVALAGVDVVGWIAGSLISARPVYRGVVEHSVYVRPDHLGQGIGRSLLAAYVASTEAAGIWTLQTAIFPENAASIALHHTAGFRRVGVRERLGRHHGRWRDVILLERRSLSIS